MPNNNQNSDSSNRGFASMDPEKQKDIASKGGKASQGGRSSNENESEQSGRSERNR